MSYFCLIYIRDYINEINSKIYNLKISCFHLFALDGTFKLYRLLHRIQNLLNSQLLCAIKQAAF